MIVFKLETLPCDFTSHTTLSLMDPPRASIAEVHLCLRLALRSVFVETSRSGLFRVPTFILIATILFARPLDASLDGLRGIVGRMIQSATTIVHSNKTIGAKHYRLQSMFRTVRLLRVLADQYSFDTYFLTPEVTEYMRTAVLDCTHGDNILKWIQDWVSTTDSSVTIFHACVAARMQYIDAHRDLRDAVHSFSMARVQLLDDFFLLVGALEDHHDLTETCMQDQSLMYHFLVDHSMFHFD